MDDNVATKDEENVEDAAPEQEEVREEVAETPESTEEEAPEETEEVEEEPAEAPVPQASAPKLDIQAAVNDDGTIDLSKLQEWADGVQIAAEQRASTTVDTKLQESQQWERVWKKYPDWKDNKQMRDLIHKQRIGNMYAGGKNDLVKAADTIAKISTKAEAEGRQRQQTSITQQKAASLETASNTTDSKQSNRRELVDKISSRNRQEAEDARNALLKDMIDSGEITF